MMSQIEADARVEFAGHGQDRAAEAEIAPPALRPGDHPVFVVALVFPDENEMHVVRHEAPLPAFLDAGPVFRADEQPQIAEMGERTANEPAMQRFGGAERVAGDGGNEDFHLVASGGVREIVFKPSTLMKKLALMI